MARNRPRRRRHARWRLERPPGHHSTPNLRSRSQILAPRGILLWAPSRPNLRSRSQILTPGGIPVPAPSRARPCCNARRRCDYAAEERSVDDCQIVSLELSVSAGHELVLDPLAFVEAGQSRAYNRLVFIAAIRAVLARRVRTESFFSVALRRGGLS